MVAQLLIIINFIIDFMGQQPCCDQPYEQDEIVLNFDMINQEEPAEQTVPTQLKEDKQHVLISTKGYQNGVDGDIVNFPPTVTEAAFKKLQTLHQFHVSDTKFPIRGNEKRSYFRFRKNGIVYIGQWKDGIPNGLGKNYYPDGSLYEGSFVDGIPHGYGRFIYENGEYYHGDVKFGRQNGFGTYQSVNSTYKGSFVDNLKHGKGEEKGQSSYFQGQYEYGQKREGTLKNKNYVYEGQFYNELFDGKGKLASTEGQYFGSFSAGKYHGFGELKYTNGSTYKGKFNKGKREGEGQLIEKNREVSKGRWKVNVLNGQGFHKDANGKEQACIWENGKIASYI